MNLGHIGAGIVVTLLPGLACLVWLERPRRDLPGYLADALGLSISITALLGLDFLPARSGSRRDWNRVHLRHLPGYTWRRHWCIRASRA